MVTVEIITNDGKVHTDPSEVKIERNEKTEQFFRMLENFVAKEDHNAGGSRKEK